MSLRTKILLITVPSVLLLVAAFSTLLLANLIEANLRGTHRLAVSAIQQTKEALLMRLEEASRQGAASKEKWTEAIAADDRLKRFLTNTIAQAPSLVELSVAASDGRILISSTQAIAGSPLRQRPPLDQLLMPGLRARLQWLFEPSRDYELRVPIGLLDDPTPIFTVQVLASTALVKNQISGGLRVTIFATLAALLLSLTGVSILAGFVSRNLRGIEQSIDTIRKGEPVPEQPPPASAPEFAAVQSKLSLLGAEVRDTARTAADFRSRINQVLDRLEEGILLFDAQGQLVLSGGASRRILGDSLNSLQASNSPLAAPLAEAFRTGIAPAEQLLEWPRPEGGVRLHAAFDLLSKERCLVRLRDAEGRRDLESQLELLNRLDGINRLTGGVAHEIKNPLNSIAAHVALLESMVAGESSEAEEEVRVIGEEVERLDRVVRTFLDFTRPVELNQAKLDLAALASEVAAFIQPDAARRNVAVKTEADPAEACIWGDEDVLRQALMNLAVNALDAMPDGGSLTFRLHTRAPQGFELTISDTGVGIPPEKQEKIFQLYFTTKKHGSGIGLAMVYRAVQLHGGTITVESKPGAGAQFHLTFPALEA